MKLGLGLYKQLLNDDNFRFAKQTGVSHIVVQLVEYVQGDSPTLTRDYLQGWGVTNNHDKLWQYDDLVALRKQIESHGLTLEAIENFDPSHWYDVLLDGPLREKQMENLKNTIRNIGKAGIPIMGYYFSLAGVWGWTAKETGRGQAKSIEFDQSLIDINTPIPKGMVWNMTYDTNAPEGVVESVSEQEIWDRLERFLDEMLPVAEENNVKLVAHPDDPPVPTLRNTARLFYKPSEYERLLELSSSKANGFEFCMGTLQEMPESDVYQLLDKYSQEERIGYIHFRNVKGKVPHYREAFVDEGDLDMVKALKVLKKNNYQGILIPDHTPEMTCGAPWHAGMAYALGFMKGAMRAIQ